MCISAVSQETTGELYGRVQDPSGATISGATVRAVSNALIGSAVSHTSADGAYRLPGLPPGQYTVFISAAGFARHEQRGVYVSAGNRFCVDAVLRLGSSSETVEVHAASPQIDFTQSKAGINVSAAVIENLPKSRSFRDLINLAPGAVPAVAGSQIDGASDSESAYMFDGSDRSSVGAGGVFSAAPGYFDTPVDFVQELQVNSSGFAAEFGGGLGGVVNVIPKSGGDRWHGDALFYYTSDALTASPRPTLQLDPTVSVNTKLRLSPPAEYYQPRPDNTSTVDPGFDVGGPLLRNRLWIYASYLPDVSHLSRTVNFTFKDPFTGAVKDGPRTSSQDTATQFGLARLDWSVSHYIRAHAVWQNSYTRSTGVQIPDPDSAYGQFNLASITDPDTYNRASADVMPNASYTAGVDVFPTRHLSIESHFGYWFTNLESRGVPTGVQFYFDFPSTGVVGLDGTPVPSAFQEPANFQNIPDNTQNYWHVVTRTTAAGSVSYLTGGRFPHQLKFGYEMNRLADSTLVRSTAGQVFLDWGQEYTPGSAQAIATCASVAAAHSGLCEGNFGTYYVQDLQSRGDVHSSNQSLFAQDSWTLRDVTLNYGVRFDAETLPSYQSGYSGLTFGFPDKAAPRLGAAWNVLGKSKLKVFASWGLEYDIMKYALAGLFGSTYLHYCAFTLDTADYTQIHPQLSAGGTFCPGGTPSTGTLLEEFNAIDPVNDPALHRLQPGIRPMRQHDLVFGSEYAVNPALTFAARYVRKRLDDTIETIGVDDGTATLVYVGNPGEGLTQQLWNASCPACPPQPKAIRNYDGLEFRLTSKTSARAWFDASYTYSRLWGNYSGLAGTDVNARRAPNNTRYFDYPWMQFDAAGHLAVGPLATDRPHMLKMHGYYDFRWHGMDTIFAVAQVVQSGTPVTTEVSIGRGAVEVVNRGNFLPLTRGASGTIAGGPVEYGRRTPTFTQSDLAVTESFRLSRTHEQLRASVQVTATNALNQNTHGNYASELVFASGGVQPPLAAGAIDAYKLTTGGFDWLQAANARRSTLNSLYGLPREFQLPRQLRLRLRFSF